jgi:hypothetical protein
MHAQLASQVQFWALACLALALLMAVWGWRR